MALIWVSTDKWLISPFKPSKQPCKAILTTKTGAKGWLDFVPQTTQLESDGMRSKSKLSRPRVLRFDITLVSNLGDHLGYSRCSR